MKWLLVGGVAGLAVRAVFWVIAWYLIDVDWHWALRGLAAWVMGDLFATVAMKMLGVIR